MKKEDNRNILGIILVVAGVGLLLNNLDIVPDFISDIVFTWQVLLILLGTIFIVTGKNNTSGLVLIVIGGFFLAPEIIPFTFSFTTLFWPVLLVIIGVLFITKYRKRDSFDKYLIDDDTNNDAIDEMAIFGGNKKRIFSKAFSGGKITCIFGGVELDLSQCELNFGPQFIDVVTVFGGTKITVPDNWSVRMEITPIFGGFVDKRNFKPDQTIQNENVLIIKGIALFGGGEIESH